MNSFRVGILFIALGALNCGGEDGPGSSNTSGGGSTSRAGGGGSTSGSGGDGSTSTTGSTGGGGSSNTTGGGTTTTTSTSTSGGGGGGCIGEGDTFATDLPYSNSGTFVDQDCTSSTASNCVTGNCIEWTDSQGKHGKCFVYCSELQSNPPAGQACSGFATCRSWKGANMCLPNSLNACTSGGSTSGGSSDGSTSGGSTSGGSTSGGSTSGGTTGGGTTGGSCLTAGNTCDFDLDCCSGNCCGGECGADDVCNQ